MRKIAFSDRYGLTEAVISGGKTQTRRILKPQPTFRDTCGIVWNNAMYGLSAEVGAKIIKGACHNFITGTEYDKRCNRFRVGDVVAVAQSYNSFYNDECDPRQFPSGLGWTNKMYVKSELMPHCIRITNVRLERLQDISEEDCFAEGIYKYHGMRRWHYKFNDKTKNTAYDHKSAREAYADLIDRISGKGTWKSNPWVLVYDFELIK